jgi:hypothetical protein
VVVVACSHFVGDFTKVWVTWPKPVRELGSGFVYEPIQEHSTEPTPKLLKEDLATLSDVLEHYLPGVRPLPQLGRFFCERIRGVRVHKNHRARLCADHGCINHCIQIAPVRPKSNQEYVTLVKVSSQPNIKSGDTFPQGVVVHVVQLLDAPDRVPPIATCATMNL